MKYFWPYRFDDAAGELWHRSRRVPLSPKAMEVLRRLLVEPGQSVGVDRLLSSVWMGVHVHPGNVKSLVHELRSALHDSVTRPRFIRSDHGRGYAFVAGVTAAPAPFSSNDPDETAEILLPGRDLALATILNNLAAARDGATRVVFLEGERGFGKTTICRRVAAEVRSTSSVRITHGQAVNGYGLVEPYGVMVDALALCLRQYPELTGFFKDVAPTWWARIANGTSIGETSHDRLLRELMAGFAELSQGSALLVFLDDLDDADAATISTLRHLARASTSTGTCVVATFGPRGGTQAVELERLTEELAYESSTSLCRLNVLTQREVACYLEGRFGASVACEIESAVFDASAGHPHLLRFVVDSLLALGVLRRSGGRWRLVQREDLHALAAAAAVDLWRFYLRRLNPFSRRLLDAAANIGLEFLADDVAGATSCHPEVVKQQLAREANRRVIIERAAATDLGTGPAFRFRSPVVADQLLATATLAAGDAGIDIATPASALRTA